MNTIKRSRLDYLDNLKSILTCLVIIHHVIISYGGEGFFIITARSKGSEVFNLFLTAILAINQSFFMGLFFLISAYFSYKSFRKKDRKTFILNKFKRLLMPALIYLLVISPMLSLIIDVLYKKVACNELTYRTNIGALWFLVALFIFDCIFAFAYSHKDGKKEKKLPHVKQLFLWIILVAIVSWIVRIFFPIGAFIPVLSFQPAHFPQYIFAYTIGVLMSKYYWLELIPVKKCGRLIWGTILLIIVMFAFVGFMIATVGGLDKGFGGFNLYSLLYSWWDQMMFVVTSLGLISLFKVKYNKKGKLISFMSQNAFGAYIAHSFAIIIIVMILSLMSFNHVTSFVLACVFSIILAFILGRVIKPLISYS